VHSRACRSAESFPASEAGRSAGGRGMVCLIGGKETPTGWGGDTKRVESLVASPTDHGGLSFAPHIE
jgi:hypothetical protein